MVKKEREIKVELGSIMVAIEQLKTPVQCVLPLQLLAGPTWLYLLYQYWKFKVCPLLNLKFYI